MKKRTQSVLLLCIWVSFATPHSVSAEQGETASAPALSSVEKEDLLFLREEEKLARAVYVAFYELWQRNSFNNISKSEQRHMDAVLGLLNTYGLEDTALEPGAFFNPELQALFNKLVADGRQTELNALQVGALVEEVDIEDLIEAMKRTSHSDILAVYSNLLAGSKNHLRAFVRSIERLTNEPYVAQKISQQDMDAILAR